MTTQNATIEFASNSTGNWFCVAFDADTITSIINKAAELGIKATAPKHYAANKFAPSRFLSYFNGQDTRALYAWASKQFTVRNSDRAAAAERTVEAEQLENQRLCAKAAISRYTLSKIKSAMVAVIGTPADIREMFNLYNIKIVGAAGLPQCLSLILELGKEQEVLSYLRQPKTEETVAIAVEETAEPELCVNEPTELADPVAEQNIKGIDMPVDFDPWTIAELTDKKMTIKNLVELADLSNIPLTNKQKRMTKPNLAAYLLPILNEIGLAEHLA